MPSPMRALAWKEFREHRPMVASGLAVSAALPLLLMAVTSATARGLDVAGVDEAMLLIVPCLVWPLFASLAGAAAIAPEIGDGTLGYLLSRPLSRARIWCVKLALAGSGLMIVVAGSLAFGWLFGRAAGGGALAALLSPEWRRGAGAGPALACLCAAIFLLFSCSAFFSSFVSRPLTAAAAGLVTSIAILAAITLTWSRLDLVPRLEPELLAIQVSLAGTLLLAGSLHVFARGELLEGRRAARMGALLIVASAATLLPAMTLARTRVSPAGAVLAWPMLGSGGDQVIAMASRPGGGSSQIWLIPTSGGRMRRLTGRLAAAPSLSPDGMWAAYVSHRGRLGLRSTETALRVARTDGSVDLLLASSLPGQPRFPGQEPRIVFSPDSTRVALLRGGWLVVEAVDGSHSSRLDLGRAVGRSGAILGWSRDGSEVLALLAAAGGGTSTISAIHPGSGRSRILFQAPERVFSPMMWGRSPWGDRLPLLTDGNGPLPGGWNLILVDAATGSATTIAASACVAAPDISPDLQTITYAQCRENGGFEIHVKDLRDGRDRTLGSGPGRPWQLFLSPSSERVLVHLNERGVSAMTIGPDGDTLELEPGWAPLGWSAEDRAVLAAGDQTGRIALADASTGALRALFP